MWSYVRYVVNVRGYSRHQVYDDCSGCRGGSEYSEYRKYREDKADSGDSKYDGYRVYEYTVSTSNSVR